MGGEKRRRRINTLELALRKSYDNQAPSFRLVQSFIDSFHTGCQGPREDPPGRLVLIEGTH